MPSNINEFNLCKKDRLFLKRFDRLQVIASKYGFTCYMYYKVCLFLYIDNILKSVLCVVVTWGVDTEDHTIVPTGFDQ